MPITGLRQHMKEMLTEFLRLYPMHEEHQEKILSLAEKNLKQSWLHYRQNYRMEDCFARNQLEVDITVELTKAAMRFSK